MTLNETAMLQADVLAAHAAASRCAVSTVAGARVIDCGGAVVGGLGAGLQMARVCTAGLADVTLQSGPDGPEIQLASDDPAGDIVLTCGKSHEGSMCYGTEETPWDEFAAVREGLKRRGG